MGSEQSGPGFWIRTAGTALILACAVLSPLFYGSVSGWPLWTLTGLTGVLSLIAAFEFWRSGRGLRPDAAAGQADRGSAMTRAAALLLGAFVLLVFVQTLDLGSWLGPARYGALSGKGLPDPLLPSSLSVYPGATRISLALLLSSAVPLFAAPVLMKRKEKVYAASAALAGAGGATAFYAMLNYLSSNAASVHFTAAEFGNRANGTFVNPNHFAAHLGMLIPLCLSIMFLKSKAWKRRSEDGLFRLLASAAQDASRRWWKILAGLSFVTMLVAVVFSASRMGIISAVSGVACFFFLSFLLKRAGDGGRFWTAALIVLLLGALSIAAWVGLEPVMTRFEALDPGIERRLEIWKDAAGILADFPILGTGLGTFPHVFPAYQSDALPGGYSFPHNEYLQLLTETGMLGFLLVAGAAALWTAAFIRRFQNADVRADRRKIAAGAFAGAFTMLLNCGTELSLRMPANYILFSLLAGISFAALSGGSVRVKRTSTAARGTRGEESGMFVRLAP